MSVRVQVDEIRVSSDRVYLGDLDLSYPMGAQNLEALAAQRVADILDPPESLADRVQCEVAEALRPLVGSHHGPATLSALTAAIEQQCNQMLAAGLIREWSVEYTTSGTPVLTVQARETVHNPAMTIEMTIT